MPTVAYSTPEPDQKRDVKKPTLVAWTGHRPDLFLAPDAARAAVERLAGQVTRQPGPPLAFLVGGQRGVDTWAAQAAATLQVPYVVVLPLAVDLFTADWAADDRATLEATLRAAARVDFVGGAPDQAYTKRNRRLATSADLLVAVWTGVAGGGTAETLAFARAAGTPIRESLLAPARAATHASGRGI